MKNKPIRSPKHLKYVRSLPCMITDGHGQNCNEWPVHSHHLTFIDEGGLGKKVGDNWVVPLSWGHHGELHRMGEKSFWDKYGFSLDEVKDYAMELWNKTN